MINFTKIENKFILKMLVAWKDLEQFKGSKESIELLLKEFDAVNTNESLNSLMWDVLDGFYAWYWLRAIRYKMTIEELIEEMKHEKCFTKTDVSIFKKIYS